MKNQSLDVWMQCAYDKFFHGLDSAVGWMCRFIACSIMHVSLYSGSDKLVAVIDVCIDIQLLKL